MKAKMLVAIVLAASAFGVSKPVVVVYDGACTPQTPENCKAAEQPIIIIVD